MIPTVTNPEMIPKFTKIIFVRTPLKYHIMNKQRYTLRKIETTFVYIALIYFILPK